MFGLRFGFDTNTTMRGGVSELPIDPIWDALAKSAVTTLSNNDQTASTDQALVTANVLSYVAHNSGKHCAKAIVRYASDDIAQEVVFGVALTTFNPDVDEPIASCDKSWVLDAGGQTTYNGSQQDLGLPVVYGGAMFVYYDATTGEISFANDPDEAPTFAYTVEPDTGMCLVGSMFTAIPPEVVSITLEHFSGHGYDPW